MIYTYKTENVFYLPIIILGYILLIVPILLLVFHEMVVSLPLILVGIIFAFSWRGIAFNSSNKTFKIFVSFLGIRFGKWQSLEGFPYLSILFKNTGFALHGRSQQKVTLTNRVYEISLMNESHRTRFVVKKFKTDEEAKVEAKKIATNLALKLVIYSPN